MLLIQIICCAIAVERLTELLLTSELLSVFGLKWLRDKIKELAYPIDEPPNNNWFQTVKVAADKFLTCGYCISVWVSMYIATFVDFTIFNNHTHDWIIKVLLLHGLSNAIHGGYKLVSNWPLFVRGNEINVNIARTNQHDTIVVDDI